MSASENIKKGRAWHKVTVSAAADEAEAVRRAIQSLNCCGMQSEDEAGGRERLDAYFEDEAEAFKFRKIMEVVDELLRAAGGKGISLGEIGTVPEEDWIRKWRESWGPVKISRGLVVCPPWETYARKSGERVIYIYPKMAFGTGDHPTTRMCLKLLERNIIPGDSVIDIGAGSAILAIAAARLGARKVTAVEIDEVAVENALENCRLNRVSSKVRLICAPFGPRIRGRFDLGVCNMLAHVMQPLLDDITRLLAGRKLIISGISETSALEFRREIRLRGWRIKKTLRDGEWISYLAVHEGLSDHPWRHNS